jgi:hypothetical protein
MMINIEKTNQAFSDIMTGITDIKKGNETFQSEMKGEVKDIRREQAIMSTKMAESVTKLEMLERTE